MTTGMTTERMLSGIATSRNIDSFKKSNHFNERKSISPGGTVEKKEMKKATSKDLQAVQKRK
eukprot:CAMPEP_0202968290 /NCGR_PEP_ID=MMETSP1396-20130829/13534_1 /ASSEMBLY_ACC=CAM_ASM_000872 /TAXON_ID= /ORGANISM="Pseudokeronopsis sp., Strain Brazil" /LENGTH=61 /DNA_ID=CAMNT_0049694435 /DNA_START=1035 /DNA_END=1220 /DNA_ORIENTATION=+